MSFNNRAVNVPDDEPQRHIVRWVVIVVAVVLLAWIAWVGIRALLAYSSLHNVLTASELARTDLKSNDLNKALVRMDAVSGDAANAANLTSDPAWRLAEFVPWVGQNLAAFRHSASIVNIVVNEGIGPLVDAGDAFSLSIFQPHDGTIDLAKVAAVQPAIDRAANGMKAAEKESTEINQTWLLPQLAAQTTQLAKVVGDSAAGVSSIRTAVDLMPSMLGSDGPRTYLILVQNAAELRARGGNPGAMEVVTADKGKLTLSGQGAASTFPYLATPVAGLDAETEAIYGNLPATRIQNTTGIPDFPTGAKLAQEQWAMETGQTVDGVIAVDPGVLSYLLRESGPLTLSNGKEVNADTVRQLLFQQIYSKYPNPKDQDAVFADIARTVFTAATSGQIEGTAIGSAVGRGLSEGRILMWSAQQNEQKEIGTSTLAGILPTTNKNGTTLGVYLNDVTGGKLGYYLDMKTQLSSGRCSVTSAPVYRTYATLTFTAPADAATSLPPYVTGNGVFGVTPGLVATTMYVYGPVDGSVISVIINGKTVDQRSLTNLGRSVIKIDTLLKPGEKVEVQVDFRGNVDDSSNVVLEQTPMIFANKVRYTALECANG